MNSELRQIGIGHPAVRDVLDIQRNTANKFRLFVAEGLWENNVVLDTDLPVDTFFWCPELTYSDEARKRSSQLIQRARRSFEVSAKTMARMSEKGKPDGLISTAKLPMWEPQDIIPPDNALVLVTDGLEIPGNLGTLLRSLDAVHADALIMTNRRTRMSHPKVLRASQGMSVRVPHLEFTEVPDAVAWLRQHQFTVLLADTDDSINYRQANYSGRTAIVVGSERYGVSPPWYEYGFGCVGVPMLGYADSLNVAVSASVLLYEARACKDRWQHKPAK